MSDHLVVLNKDSDSVSYIDPDSGETTAVVETDFNPHTDVRDSVPPGRHNSGVSDAETSGRSRNAEHSHERPYHEVVVSPDGDGIFVTCSLGGSLILVAVRT